MREKIIELNIDKQTIIPAMHHHQKTQQHRDPAPVSRNGYTPPLTKSSLGCPFSEVGESH